MSWAAWISASSHSLTLTSPLRIIEQGEGRFAVVFEGKHASTAGRLDNGITWELQHKGRGGKVKLRRADVESLAADLEQNSEWMTRAEVARQAGVTGEAVRVAGVKAGWQTTHAWRNEQRSPSRPSNRVLYRRAQVLRDRCQAA